MKFIRTFRPAVIQSFKLLASCEAFPRSCGLAKRMECVELAPAFLRGWWSDSASKLNALRTLRAIRLRLCRCVRFPALAGLLAILAGGCAEAPPEGRDGPGRGGLPPGPPPFLSGPMGAALATNADGFVARLTIEIKLPEGHTDVISGELMGQGSKLLFTPQATGSRGKHMRAAKISFIWDVAEGRGYILSEALQGYAPISSRARFTISGSRPSADQSGADKVEGHHCEAQEMTIASSDGSTTALRVWRVAGLKGLPVQIA